MKTEFLKSQGLTDEQITAIMSENGKDIAREQTKTVQATEKLQTELDNSKLELKTKDEQLESVNSKIQKFEGMNIEEIQKQLETLKVEKSEFETKSKSDKEAFDKAIADQARNFKLNEVVNTLKFPNDLTKKAFMNELKEKNLPLEGEKFLGFDDYVKQIGESNPGVFVTEEDTGKTALPIFTTGNTNQTTPQETGSKFGFNFNTIRPIPKE